MAIHHAAPGEVIDVTPFGDDLATHKTQTLVKSDVAELIRLVLPAGKEIPTHSAPGSLIVQCLEGRVTFTAMGSEHILTAGKMLYLPPGEPHAVTALDDSSLLLTILPVA